MRKLFLALWLSLVVVSPGRADQCVAPVVFAQFLDLTFTGLYRAGPKTSFIKDTGDKMRTPEAPVTIPELKASLLADPKVRAKYKGFTAERGEPSERFAEEMRNVTVTGYIHAVKSEFKEDHDFHIMIGNSPNIGEGQFLTVEVSGLPTDGVDHDAFLRVRCQLLSLLPRTAKFMDRFAKIDPPIPVTVVGSLFFDGAHTIGAVGPSYAKPSTVWEVHPVMDISKFE
jgi:hypothetical protein